MILFLTMFYPRAGTTNSKRLFVYIFFILLNSFAHCKTLKYVQGVDDKSTVFTTVVAGQAALSPSRPGN